MSQNIFRSYVSCPNSTSSRPRTIKLRQPPTSSYDISCGMLRSPNISEIGGQAALIGSQIDANDPEGTLRSAQRSRLRVGAESMYRASRSSK
jgi:hypothetical protein